MIQVSQEKWNELNRENERMKKDLKNHQELRDTNYKLLTELNQAAVELKEIMDLRITSYTKLDKMVVKSLVISRTKSLEDGLRDIKNHIEKATPSFANIQLIQSIAERLIQD